MQIDHVYIRAYAGAPEAQLLREFGLTEGTANTHPGQGTANRRFFFANAFIELLWMADREEITSAQTQPTMLFERLACDDMRTSPFGVCFRPSGDGALPFPAWAYRPGYLPAGMQVDIGSNTPLSEPMWFHLSFATAPAAWPPERQQPLHHPAGLERITSLSITLPKGSQLSPAAHAVAASGDITLIEGDAHLLEIEFDAGKRGLVHDFSPHLPLRLRY